MKNSWLKELYKFEHQKTLLYGILILFLLMIYGVITSKVDKKLLIFGFGAVQWVPIILIAVGSAFFEMEYNNNTIVILLYKTTSKLKIYIFKFLVVFLYGILLTGLATIFTLLLKIIFVGNKYSWTSYLSGRGPLIRLLALNMTGTIIYAFFIVSLSFMLIMLTRINAVVIGTGLAMGFLGASISVALMKSFANLVSILKWNPLNMIFITQQLANNSYAKVSNLSSFQIIEGNLLYGIIFATLGYILFRYRRV